MPRARQHASVVLPRLALTLRSRLLIGLLVGLLIGPLVGVAMSASQPQAAAFGLRTVDVVEATPLTVRIDDLTPSAIPSAGPIVVRGTVTNDDTEVWRDVTVYPFIGFAPITTEAEFDAAMATPEAAEVGQRIQVEGAYAKVGELEPGATTSFTLRVLRRHLTALGVQEPGVYWFGAHALGSGPLGRDNVADGRARTFVPLVGLKARPVSTTVIVPVRAGVTFTADGAIDDTDRWLGLLGPGGRLAHLSQLAATPGGSSLSWLVDPAVLDAVKRLAEGNPTRPIEFIPPEDSPSSTPTPGGSASSDPSGAPEAGAAGSSAASTVADVRPAASADLATLAQQWWAQMSATLATADVLALPYGDLDLAGAAQHGPATYTTARARSTEALKLWGIPSTAVNAPVGGLLDRATVAMLEERDPTTPVLISDAALPEGTQTAQVTSGNLRLIAFDSATSAGGPAPTEALGGTALRQRVLAETALRSLGPTSVPVIVDLPVRWSVTDATELADGLNQPWVGLQSLTATLNGAATTPVDAAALLIEDEPSTKAVDRRRFSAATELIRAGRTLQRVLTGNTRVASAVAGEALTSLSYQRRPGSPSSDLAARYRIEEMLAQVTITAPRSVTLSGSSGRFAVTVNNDLEFPVSVALKPVTDVGISISTPQDVDVAPGTSATIVLEAGNARVGVHDVRLVLMDSAGTRLGTQVSVPVRTAQVSKIIWVFLAVGCGLLFGAIGSRLFRRLRAAKRRSAEADGAIDD